jgi:hypothetical protein
MSDCEQYVVSEVLFTTAKHCPQRWPKKDGTPYWRCKDPITHFMRRDDGMGGAVCQKHLDFYRVDCEDAA